MSALAISFAKPHGFNSKSSIRRSYLALARADDNFRTYRFRSLDQPLPLQYSVLPNSNLSDSDNIIALLHEYTQGADGRVWLASYSDGTLVVVKFPCPKRGPSDNSAIKAIDSELVDEVHCWNEIYPDHLAYRINICAGTADTSSLASFLLNGAGQAFLFPYVFCAKHDPMNEKQLRFESMSELQDMLASTSIETKDQPGFSQAESNEVTKIIESANQKPMPIAESAVDHLLQAGWEHLDVQWRHVGFLITRASAHSREGDAAPPLAMNPVLIDLGRMERLPRCCDSIRHEVKAAARQRMIKTLICTFKDGLCHCEPADE